MATQRLARDVFHRANALFSNLPHGHLGSRALISSVQRNNFSASVASSDGGDLRQNRPGLPLDAEWSEMARKQLKGADPAEKLTWQTPEVHRLYTMGASLRMLKHVYMLLDTVCV